MRLTENLAQAERYSNLCTVLERPWGFQQAEASRFHDSRHM